MNEIFEVPAEYENCEFFENVTPEPNVPKKRGRKRKVNVEPASRGEYLMKVLGLTNVKKTRKSTRKQTSVEKQIAETNKAFEKRPRRIYKVSDFTVKEFSEGWGFTHKTWKNTYCLGGKTESEAKLAIIKYVDCTKKPNIYGNNLSWLHLIKEAA